MTSEPVFIIKSIWSVYLESVSIESSCLVFNETSLKPDLYSLEFFTNKFHVFRKDNPDRTGGGVSIAMRDLFLIYSFEFPTPRDVEFIVTRVKLAHKNSYLTYSYMCRLFVTWLRYVCMVVALGDFNLPQVTWCLSVNSGCIVATTTTSKKVIAFFDNIYDRNFLQRNGRLLDLSLVNCSEIAINRYLPFSLLKDPYHLTICLSFQCQCDDKLSLSNISPIIQVSLAQISNTMWAKSIDLSAKDMETLISTF